MLSEVELDRMLLKEQIKSIEHVFDGPWINLYLSDDSEQSSSTIYSALIAPEAVSDVLMDRSWDLMFGSTGIGYSTSGDVSSYSRNPEDGIEILLVPRAFTSPPGSRFEICEEFRLFHGLTEDWDTGKWFKSDEDGEKVLVAEIQADLIRVMKAPLLKFLQAKQMHLATYFEFDERLDGTENPVPVSEQELDVIGSDRIWGRHTAVVLSYILSRIMGKVLLAPPPFPSAEQVHSDFMGNRDCEDFNIGYLDDGGPKYFTCDPDELANFFGANPDAPQYVTPVHFDLRVLDRYYSDPDRFEVRDGHLSCSHQWGIRIDNDLHDRVIVLLGDLGRDLPHKHQLHWKSFNIPPDGGPSRTAYKRGVLAEPTNAESPEHVIKARFSSFQNAWLEKFGWQVFLPVAPADEELIKRLRIPSGTGVSSFDEQILILTKLLNDSINVKALRKIVGQGPEREGSITLFGRYLCQLDYPHAERAETLLRDLQTVRSTGAAHRKGKNYDKAIKRLEVDTFGRQKAVILLLKDLSDMLESIQNHAI